jgi:glutathione S-transferase
MKLYYSPGACSLATHIALVESGLPYSLVSVGRDKKTGDARDYMSINPKGYVPALELDDGAILTENPVILGYIADKAQKLLPDHGLDRWRALEATSFMAVELHGNFRPFFNPESTEAEKDRALQALARRFATIADQLGNKQYLVGDTLTTADCYLFVMLEWAAIFKMDVPGTLADYRARMQLLPAVQQALSEEGLA